MTGDAAYPDARWFPGPLAAFATNLVWDEAAAGETEVDPWAELPNRLMLFHAAVGGAWPAAASLWVQTYVNALLIPAICLLASGRANPSRHIRIAGEFCPSSGAPVRFRMAVADPTPSEAPDPRRFIDGVGHHLGRLVDGVHRFGRLSRPMMWESVGRTAAWTLDQLALDDRAAASRAADAMVGTALAPGPRPTGTGDADPAVARRFCCLRYQVPGFGECPAICPRGHSRCEDRRMSPPVATEDRTAKARRDAPERRLVGDHTAGVRYTNC